MNELPNGLLEIAQPVAAAFNVEHVAAVQQPVGIVWAEGSGKRAGTWVNLSHEMVRLGLAWLDPDVADPELAALEAEAREQKIGLWALPEAERVPPWEWRAAKAEEKRLRRLEQQASKASKEVRK